VFAERRWIDGRKLSFENGGDWLYERERIFSSSLAVKIASIRPFESNDDSKTVRLDHLIEDIEAEPDPEDCWNAFLLYGVPLLLSALIGVIPGVYRVLQLTDELDSSPIGGGLNATSSQFFGSDDTERSIVSIFLISCLGLLFFLYYWMELSARKFERKIAYPLRYLFRMTSATMAKKFRQQYWMDIAEQRNLMRWLNMRQSIQKRVAREAQQTAKSLTPILILFAVLVLTMLVRVYFLPNKAKWDKFNIIALALIITLTAYLVRVLYSFANANSVLLGDHLEVLRKRQFDLISQAHDLLNSPDPKAPEIRQRKLNSLRLLEKAEFHVSRYESKPVTIFGQAIRVENVTQLILVAATAGLSVVGNFVSKNARG